MENKYKGYSYKTRFEIVWWSCFGPHIGTLFFDSTLLSYKMEEIPLDDTIPLYEHILTRKFKDTVDGK